MLVYFAGFKNHIGMFPPVRGDARLVTSLKRYQGPKGNLRFPLDEPMPLALIARNWEAASEAGWREKQRPAPRADAASEITCLKNMTQPQRISARFCS